MTGLEQILLELDTLDLEVAIHEINDQIVYYSKHRHGVEGISLMSIRDHLINYSDDFLRGNGYILNIAQFKEDCEQYLKLAAKDPILYNKSLKRLHRGLVVLKRDYVNGKLRNKVVSDEMQKHFTEVMQSCYSHGTERKIPDSLRVRIESLIAIHVAKLNESWFGNTLPPKLTYEFSHLLETYLLSDWRERKLSPSIMKLLDEEKSKINSIDAIIALFQERTLEGDAQDKIFSALNARLQVLILGKKITAKSNALGKLLISTKVKTTLGILNPDENEYIERVIRMWQSKIVNEEASMVLKEHIAEVIKEMKIDLDNALSQQFEKLSVQHFIRSLYKADCSKVTQDEMKQYALSMANTTLRFMRSSNPAELSLCSEFISNEVMNQLHGEWISNTLSDVERNFISETVFASLNELDEKVQHYVWKHESVQSKQFASMQREIAELKEMIVELVSQSQQSVRPSAPNNTTVVRVEEKPAEHSSSFGFFGRK